jgi:thiol-disulfide isomerase/thioredoxin
LTSLVASSRSRLTVVGVFLAGVVVIGLVVAHVSSGSGPTNLSVDDPVGKIQAIPAAHRVPAKVLAGPLLGGGRYDPATDAGHVTVINAWGSWCEPCRAELPILRRLALATYPTTVHFLGLDVEDTESGGQSMVRQYAVPYPSIFDADRLVYTSLAPSMAGTGTPGTVVIDAEGRIAATVIGPVDEAAMSAYLRQLATEQP